MTLARDPLARLCAALLLLAACRGLALLCVLPPGEGWDEYQHVAYVVHWLDTGERPVYGRAAVPRRLLEEMQAWPQPDSALEPFRQRGLPWPRSYAEHWSRPPVVSPEPDASIPLYEAQQGDLYYRVVAPLFRSSGGVGALERSTSVLRALNVLAQLLALALLLAALPRLCGDPGAAAWLALVVATLPLPLVSAARVASDAFGALAATLAIVLGLSLPRRAAAYAALGLALGVAVRMKAVHYALAPFLLACAWMAWRRQHAGARWLASRLALLAGVAALVAAPEVAFNLRHYGTLSGMQEVIANRAAGRSQVELWTAAASALARLWRVVGRDGLYVGGWSFVMPPPVFGRLYAAALAAGLVAGAARARSWQRGADGLLAAQVVPLVILLVCSHAAAMAYHMGHFFLVHGQWPSNPWYVAAVSQWLAVLALAGAATWGRTPATLLAGLLVALHLAAEAATLPAMASRYAGGAGAALTLERLAALHPGWLGTATLVVAVAGALTSLAAALWLAVRVAAPGASPDRMLLSGVVRET